MGELKCRIIKQKYSFVLFLKVRLTSRNIMWIHVSFFVFFVSSPVKPLPVQLKERSKNPKRLHNDLDGDENPEDNTSKDEGWTERPCYFFTFTFLIMSMLHLFSFLFFSIKNYLKKQKKKWTTPQKAITQLLPSDSHLFELHVAAQCAGSFLSFTIIILYGLSASVPVIASADIM